MKMSRQHKGLRFYYKIDGTKLVDRYPTIEDFMKTEFPKNDNLLSPNLETEIFDILE